MSSEKQSSRIYLIHEALAFGSPAARAKFLLDLVGDFEEHLHRFEIEHLRNLVKRIDIDIRVLERWVKLIEESERPDQPPLAQHLTRQGDYEVSANWPVME